MGGTIAPRRIPVWLLLTAIAAVVATCLWISSTLGQDTQSESETNNLVDALCVDDPTC